MEGIKDRGIWPKNQKFMNPNSSYYTLPLSHTHTHSSLLLIDLAPDMMRLVATRFIHHRNSLWVWTRRTDLRCLLHHQHGKHLSRSGPSLVVKVWYRSTRPDAPDSGQVKWIWAGIGPHLDQICLSIMVYLLRQLHMALHESVRLHPNSHKPLPLSKARWLHPNSHKPRPLSKARSQTSAS